MSLKKVCSSVFFICFILYNNFILAQLSITSVNSNNVIDFDNIVVGVNYLSYNGNGLLPFFRSGVLSSTAWKILGFSDGDTSFGGSFTSSDFARGLSSGDVSQGGLYAFQVDNRALGVQPEENDFTPGSIILKVINNTGDDVSSIDLEYEVWNRNNEDKASSFNLSYSLDDVTYTDLSSFNYTSPEDSDSNGWVENYRGGSITGLSLANGASIYLRWSSNDVSGTGASDEFALDDINIIMKRSRTSTFTNSSGSFSFLNPSNWSNGLPDRNTNVIIDQFALLDFGESAEVNNLTANSDFRIRNGSLKVHGSYIGGDRIQYEKQHNNNNWQLSSLPVNSEVLDDFWVLVNNIALGTNNNTGIGFYIIGIDNWFYRQVGENITPALGSGFSLKTNDEDETPSVFYEGKINDTSVTISGLFNLGNGFNLLGNPYTSYINSATFLQDNSDILVSETIWVWNSTNQIYETYVTIDDYFIEPTRGFFARVAIAGSSATFDKANQFASIPAGKNITKSTVKLNINNGNKVVFTKLYYLDNKKVTPSFDNGFDGELFGGQTNDFEIYSHLLENNNNRKFQVQSLPKKSMETQVIPIGVKAIAGKEITFTAETVNIPNDLNVYLEDRLTNTVTRLDEANAEYKIRLSENLDGTGRFYLHTKTSSVLSTDEVVLSSVRIFTTDNAILRIAGLQQGTTSLKMYSMLGKQVLNTSFTSNTINDINLPKLSAGVYIVQLETENGSINKKITLE